MHFHLGARAIFVVLILLAAGARTSFAQPGQCCEAFYTAWKTSLYRADVVNGGPFHGMVQLRAARKVTGQQWLRSKDPQRGFYTWTSLFLGPDMCLDTINGGQFNNFIKFMPCGHYTGQRWFQTGGTFGGYYHWYNNFGGPGMCLDVVNGGPMNGFLHLTPCGHYWGQNWSREPSGGEPRQTPSEEFIRPG